ncbi:MAG: S-methyl-5'-thioadenosine phosphorylase [Pseudomonadota bacterium]
MAEGRIGIIGGSGLYDIEGVKIEEERTFATPFGAPSDAIMLGTLEGKEVAFIPRHGHGHRILPHEINFRANIYALKSLGVNRIISVSAVGSMREEIKPGELVMVDQFVDRTKDRPQTFFGNGIAAHVAFADPVCKNLKEAAISAAKEAGIRAHSGGTYVCIEGPMFSSRAESHIYRSWGVNVIGMTNYQEAKLAREAEICYTTIALVTDYDCWRAEDEGVDVEMIVKTLTENVEKAKKVIKKMLPTLTEKDCACHHALENAIMTKHELIPEEVKRNLKPIIGKYVK